MKIKRYLAGSMREAIRHVREELGPEAVILSNRRVAGGIEVVAATDYDAALMQSAVRRQEVAATADHGSLTEVPVPPPASATFRTNCTVPSLPIAPKSSGIPQRTRPILPRLRPSVVQSEDDDRVTLSGQPPAPRQPPRAAEPAPSDALRKLLQQLEQVTDTAPSSPRPKMPARSVVSEDISLVAATATPIATVPLRSSPERTAALKTMAELGIDQALAREIVAELPAGADHERARLMPLGALSRRLKVTAEDRILDGGIIALIGPTGVGKTTTLAKLAARFAERHGTRDLALVTTDHYRVGAQEQLFTYGRLLGVPVQSVGSAEGLRECLLRLVDRKLVLIDTAGMAPRDQQLAIQLAELSAAGRAIERWLVLAGTTQGSDQEEILRCFGEAQPSAAIVTKVDEATRIGGALSALIRHQLPLAYICDGQRVPEDIQSARPDQLVLRAMQAARRQNATAQQHSQSESLHARA